MTCANCGGLVQWMGPITNLTHTQCLRCGAINSQVEGMDESTVIHPAVNVLTNQAQQDREAFILEYGEEGNCSCHLSAPCASCVHPGNPLNQTDDECWENIGEDE